MLTAQYDTVPNPAFELLEYEILDGLLFYLFLVLKSGLLCKVSAVEIDPRLK